jgi:cytochrome c peroxidase
VDVAVFAAGRRALTANHTADSVSLVDLQEGTVLAEVACGRKPAAVACSPDGRRAMVSNLWSGTIAVLEIGTATLNVAGRFEVGAFPRGLVFAPDGNSVYAAVGDEVLRLDCKDGQIHERWPAPREPRRLALSPDGRWLAAASSRSGQVRCWNLATGKLHWERTIEDGFNLRGLAFAPDGRSVLCSHVVRRDFPVSRDNIEQGWVTDSRVTKLALAPDVVPCTWQIALDMRGRAAGDPEGLACVGDHLALAAGGSHELLLLEAAPLPWNAGDPGDFLDPQLHEGNRFRRVQLGGRPLAVAQLGKDQVVVANYLLDSLQVVDVAQGTVVRSIALGAPVERPLARQGEALFYDAGRSHNQWFSCHTCHVEGHTCGLNFDTLNDDSYGTPKLTPSLRNVTKTGPWTWHGKHKDLGKGVTASLTTTMFGPSPTPHEVAALLAFLDTLTSPPNPHCERDGSLSAAAQRGQDLFHGKAGCSRCHRPPHYTSPSVYDVKLDGSDKLWNPPSLVGVYDRGPYLHDGRARTLEELLQQHHTPPMLGGESLTAAERADLIAFLRTR